MRKAPGSIATLAVVATLAGCSGKPDAQSSDPGAPAPYEPSAVESAPAPVAEIRASDLGRVCRAAVAALNGRDPTIIKVERVESGVAHVGYVRPNDGKVWKNQCRVLHPGAE